MKISLAALVVLLVAATESHDQAVNVVHGVLQHYDLATWWNSRVPPK